LVKILIGRILHVGSGGFYARKKGNSNRNDRKNGKESSKRAFDLAEDIF